MKGAIQKSGSEEGDSNLGLRMSNKAEKRSRKKVTISEYQQLKKEGKIGKENVDVDAAVEHQLQHRLQTVDLGDKERAFQEDLIRVCTLLVTKQPLVTGDFIPPPELALEYYKTNIKGGDYEFVELKMQMGVDTSTIHINFTARLKGSSNSDPQLFFAELKNGWPMTVTHCCKLDHTTYPVIPDGEIRPPDLRVLHCDCVKCDSCSRKIITDEYGREYI